MTTRSAAFRGWRRAVLLLGGLLICCVWIGCSERKNYKLLSFFFDGVPKPLASELTTAGGGSVDPKEIAGHPHKAYEDGRCKECHGKDPMAFETLTIDPKNCLKCHDKILNAYPIMHGPVVMMACLWCHAPHGSQFRGMLRSTSRDICGQCHDDTTLGSKPPEHRDPKAQCLDCHVGHGSARRKFLRSQPPATQPMLTTQPAPTVSAPAKGGPA